MRHGDARIRGRADGAGDAGHHLEADARGRERLRLLAAASEHKGIAALEPYDGAAGGALLHEDGVDLLLGEVDLARRLARGDQLGARRCERQQSG